MDLKFESFVRIEIIKAEKELQCLKVIERNIVINELDLQVESSRAPSVTRLAGTTPQSRAGSVTSLRRGPTIRTSSEDPNKQSLNDRFDQYKRPPSRDSSVDR